MPGIGFAHANDHHSRALDVSDTLSRYSSIRFSIDLCQQKQDYIHLANVREVWTSPITSNPRLEPVFAAAMHALEIGM